MIWKRKDASKSHRSKRTFYAFVTFLKCPRISNVSHIIIHRLILESGNIYIGLQKSGRGLRFTGFYSLGASSDDDGGGDAAATPVPEITADRVITELNRLKDNTQDMVQILVQFFGKLHLFHNGYSAIFENIRGF